MKTKLIFALSLVLCSACSNGDAEQLAKIRIQDDAQHYSARQIEDGSKWLYRFDELLGDGSSPEFHARLSNHIILPIRRVDREIGSAINLLSDLKMELMKSIGASIKGKTGILQSEQRGIFPAVFELKGITSDKTTDLLDYNSTNGSRIKRTFIQLRHYVTEQIVVSSSTEDRQFYFRDPNIKDFTDLKDLRKKLEPTLKDVSFDDQWGLFQVYATLSKSTDTWKELLKPDLSWIDAFALLTSLEQEVLRARRDALVLISLRVGCMADYGFTELEPVVFGPNFAPAGETVELRLLLAAYDPDKAPIVTISTPNASLIHVKNGQGFIRFTATKPGKQIIKGTITILNKSGVPKTLPWETTINVVN